jgi:plasmid stabilization system protein ParE
VSRALILPSAKDEFFAAITYYNQARAGLGLRFVDAVEAAVSRALSLPDAGGPTIKSARRIPVKNFPYWLIYRPEPDGILIVAVAHQSRKPGYWSRRVPAV